MDGVLQHYQILEQLLLSLFGFLIYFPSDSILVQPLWTGSSTSQHIFRTATTKNVEPKLDSKFILDVNVIDGTVMAPSTAFTKIWRMRNNGTIAWPKGAQLVWIGGDKFIDTNLVDLQVLSDLEVCCLSLLQFSDFFMLYIVEYVKCFECFLI